MGFVDKFKDMFVTSDDDYEEDEDVDFIPEKEERTSSHTENNSKKSNKVVNIHATTQLQVILVKPEQFEDASTIADHLNAKKTVVLILSLQQKSCPAVLLTF